MNTLNPRIYVNCLSSYKNGLDYGAWIDASQGVENILNEIKALLASSPTPPASEWIIRDQRDFVCIELYESIEIEEVAKIAEFIKKHDVLGAVLLGYYGWNVSIAKIQIENYYLSESSNVKTVREIVEFIKDHGEIGAFIAGGCGIARKHIQNYRGVFESKEDAARFIAEQEGEISWLLKNCIDYIFPMIIASLNLGIRSIFLRRRIMNEAISTQPFTAYRSHAFYLTKPHN